MFKSFHRTYTHSLTHTTNTHIHTQSAHWLFLWDKLDHLMHFLFKIILKGALLVVAYVSNAGLDLWNLLALSGMGPDSFIFLTFPMIVFKRRSDSVSWIGMHPRPCVSWQWGAQLSKSSLRKGKDRAELAAADDGWWELLPVVSQSPTQGPVLPLNIQTGV